VLVNTNIIIFVSPYDILDSSGKLRVWSWDNPEHMTKLELPVFAGEIKDLDWDFESKKIVAVGDGSPLSAKVFTWDTGNSVGELVGHTKRVCSVAFKPSRPFRIISASEDMKTIFYAGPPFKNDHSNSVHTNFVNCTRYSPNGEHIVSVSSDKKLQLYDGKTGEPTQEVVDAHAGSIYSAAFSADSTKLLTTSADKTGKLWDVSSLICEQTFTPVASPAGPAQVGDMQVGALFAGSHMISLSLNGNLNILDPSVQTPVRVIQGHQVAITALTLDRENGVIYSGSFDGVVCATSVNTGISTRLIGQDNRSICGAAHGGMITGLGLSNGSLVSVGWDDSFRRADIAGGSYVSAASTNGQPCGICCNDDMTVIATLNEVSIYCSDNKVATLSNVSYSPTCVALFGTQEVAVGGSDNKTHIYSIADGVFAEIHTVETRSKVSAVAYSPLGDALAIGDEGRQIEVYERGTWEARVKGRWVFHTSRVTCLAWSPSGNLLASGGLDENIFIWNCAKPLTKQHLPFSHAAGVTGVAWIDENRLVSAGNDHVIAMWRLPESSA
jgi:WD repeat-containing protein 1 (actin-interacting protein 1)